MTWNIRKLEQKEKQKINSAKIKIKTLEANNALAIENLRLNQNTSAEISDNNLLNNSLLHEFRIWILNNEEVLLQFGAAKENLIVNWKINCCCNRKQIVLLESKCRNNTTHT